MAASIISFILIFSIIVWAHEFGHYLLARKNGIHVVEFFIGMGPSLISFSRGGTKYSLKIFPIGGACLFEGETGNLGGKDPDRDKDPDAQGVSAGNRDLAADNAPAGTIVKEPGAGSFLKASPWGRFSTIVAGPIFNFILAYILGLIIIANTGIDLPIIGEVTPGGQAEIAGLMPGDVITRINSENIHIYRQIFLTSYISRGEPLQVTYERDGVKNTVEITPTYSKEAGRYLMGISGSGEYSESKGLNVFKHSFYEVQFGMTSTLKSLLMLVQGRLGGDEVSGFVGMAAMVGETYETAKPYGISVVILSMLNIAMILSVNLGIMNLLPLPALDGGRLVFVIIEMVRGKPVAPEKEGMVHLAGMIALLVLMVIVLFNDIAKFF